MLSQNGISLINDEIFLCNGVKDFFGKLTPPQDEKKIDFTGRKSILSFWSYASLTRQSLGKYRKTKVKFWAYLKTLKTSLDYFPLPKF